jgi:hypothetical protein
MHSYSTFPSGILGRLLVVAGSSFVVLAGCTSEVNDGGVQSTKSAGEGGGAGTAGFAGTAGTAGTSGSASSAGMGKELPPIPPPKNGNSYPSSECATGSPFVCCVEVVCEDFLEGTNTCLAAKFEYGPNCPCGENQGPFAPSTLYPPNNPSENGKPCCYLVGNTVCIEY